MNRKWLAVSMLVSGILYLSPVQAHNPGYQHGSYGGVSGNVTIWSGAAYGPGFSGTINYGGRYPPAPPYAGAYWYPTCGHWHPKSYKAPRNHAYAKGYAHGYADSYYDGQKGYKSHKGHKKPKHKSKHKNGHEHGYGYDRGRH